MLFFDVLFEDDRILAVNKKSGIPSHSLAKNEADEVALTVEAQVKIERPQAQILHRLDNGTSGVLLFAKNDNVYAEMRSKFKLKDLKKYYVAWSSSPMQNLQLPMTLDFKLGHHPKSAKRMVVVDPAKKISIRGKAFPALTRIHGMRTVSRHGLQLTELEVEIETGVTHQIRAHLKHLGYPLLGDPIYNRLENEIGLYRLGLHAQRVEFGLAGFQYRIEAPLPNSLLKG